MKLLKKVAAKAVRAVKKGSFQKEPIIKEEIPVDSDLERVLNQSALEAALRESETASMQPNHFQWYDIHAQIPGNGAHYDIHTKIPGNRAQKPRRRKSSDEKRLVDEEEAQFLQAIEESLVMNYAVPGLFFILNF
jgi:hypothetical protein